MALAHLSREGIVREWKAEIWQDKMMVCRVIGYSEDDVRNEIGHYVMQYAQDGPLEVRIKPPRKRS
jgi:hypothetical protein